VALPSEVDEPESNKSSARAEDRGIPLPPAEVEDAFFPTTLMPVAEVFSAMLSPKYCATNFLLRFKGFARASSCVEVRVLEWDDLLTRRHFSKNFLGVGANAMVADLCFRTMGSGQGW
jgi:hypothetical protein